MNRSISSNLQIKALPKKTFRMYANTVSKVCHISKDSTSRNSRIKKFSTIPTRVVMRSDEIYDIYVDFKDDLGLDIYTYNMLIRKASC